jgi:hypothetical protein
MQAYTTLYIYFFVLIRHRRTGVKKATGIGGCVKKLKDNLNAPRIYWKSFNCAGQYAPLDLLCDRSYLLSLP